MTAKEHSLNVELMKSITLTEWERQQKLFIVALTVKAMILKKLNSVSIAVNMLPNFMKAYAMFALVICMASKRSKACDISPKVRQEVLERDNHQCIICGTNQGLQIAHYVSRARLGLGIPQNLATMCASCHFQFDNGKLHKEMQKAVREHLQAHYDNWNEKDLIYTKWS